MLIALPTLWVSAMSVSISAGEATDRLSVCLVENTSSQDEINLIRWIVVAYGSHPEVSDLAQSSVLLETEADIEVAKLFERLLSEDCSTETKTAIIIGGDAAIETAFSILGKVAAKSLTQDAQVSQRLEGFVRYIDFSSIQSLLQ